MELTGRKARGSTLPDHGELPRSETRFKPEANRWINAKCNTVHLKVYGVVARYASFLMGEAGF